MRKYGLILVLSLSTSPAIAQPYTIREVGFVDVEPRPFRLVLLARDLTLPAVKKQQENLAKEIAHSNIVLVAQQANAQTLTPDKKPAGVLTTPQLWLIAPDDRVIPFHAAGPMNDLLQSPLRQRIMHEVTNSLCAVVLLESTDKAANEIALAKVKLVLGEIKRVQTHLRHAPGDGIEPLSLEVADRPRERWTLWALGEEVAASKTPKVAVIFGRLRRAGPLFEGIAWNNDDLFARIASLGQVCEDELDRKEFFGPPLPFQWPKEWFRQLGLPFDPQSEDVVKEMTTILKTPELDLDHRTPRKRTPGAFNVGDEIVMDVDTLPERRPSFWAGDSVGIFMLVFGAVGWALLGLSVWKLGNWR